MTAVWRHDKWALCRDGMRAVVGMVVCAVPLVSGVFGPGWLSGALLIAVAFFGLHLLYILERGAQRVCLDDAGVRVTGWWSRRIDWSALSRLRLRYYRIMYYRGGGWMELRLAAGGWGVVIESSLEGFDRVLVAAVAAAAARGVVLDHVTLDNLERMGLGRLDSHKT